MLLRPSTYKASVDADEDNMVEIRKNGREESLQKRRRIDYHHFSAVFQTAALKKFEAAWALRNIVQAVTDDSCPQMLNLLGHRPTLLLIPTLPTVGKIFAGDDIQTQLVANADTIGLLFRLMKDNNLQLLALPLIKEILISSTDEDVLKMACWALSYISEDRDDIQAILDADVGQHLVKLFRYSSKVLYPALRTVSNIFAGFYHIQNVNNTINAESVVSLARLIQNRQLLKERVLPFLKEKLISSTDEEVLRVACWVLSCISDDGGFVQLILNAVGQQLVELLKHSTSNSVLYPVIRTVGNLFAGYAKQTQFMIDQRVLGCWERLLNSCWEISMEACYAILNITAWSAYNHRRHIPLVIDAGIIVQLIRLLENAESHVRIRIYAAHVIFNMTNDESNGQHINYLVKEGCIKALCNSLSCSVCNSLDECLVVVCLEGLENILKYGKPLKNSSRFGSVNEYAHAMDEFMGFENIRKLKDSRSEIISETAMRILAMPVLSKPCPGRSDNVMLKFT